MARLAFAVSVLLSLALLSPAHYLHSGFPNSLPDPAAIRLPSDTSSSGPRESVSLPKPETASNDPVPTVETVSVESTPIEASLIPVRRNFPFDRPLWRTASNGPVPTVETVPVESIPIEASLIPVRRNFPFDRPIWRRVGHRCRHLHHGRHGGIPRGLVISYGNDMVVSGKRMVGFVSEDQMRRMYVDGRAHRHRGGMKEISVEELMKQSEMGLPREMRDFPQWHHEEHRREGHRGLVKRFLDFLNRH